MTDFEPSPRATKRRRVTAHDSQSTQPSAARSASASFLRSLSGTVSGLSKRLFEPQRPQEHKSKDFADSTYGSKENSLNDEVANEEDDIPDGRYITEPLVESAAQAEGQSGDELNDAVTATPVKPGASGRKRAAHLSRHSCLCCGLKTAGSKGLAVAETGAGASVVGCIGKTAVIVILVIFSLPVSALIADVVCLTDAAGGGPRLAAFPGLKASMRNTIISNPSLGSGA
jgi:hypothetical protein